MSTTENLIRLLSLAHAGLAVTAPGMPVKELSQARAALKDWTVKASKMRGKLMDQRGGKAEVSSMEQLRAAVCNLPLSCQACRTSRYFSATFRGVRLDYLHHCRGTDTFDCALQCLRHRSTPWAGPLVAPVPAL